LDSLGFNPSWEAVGVQLVIAVIAVASTLVLRMRRPSPLRLQPDMPWNPCRKSRISGR